MNCTEKVCIFVENTFKLTEIPGVVLSCAIITQRQVSQVKNQEFKNTKKQNSESPEF